MYTVLTQLSGEHNAFYFPVNIQEDHSNVSRTFDFYLVYYIPNYIHKVFPL